MKAYYIQQQWKSIIHSRGVKHSLKFPEHFKFWNIIEEQFVCELQFFHGFHFSDEMKDC